MVKKFLLYQMFERDKLTNRHFTLDDHKAEILSG